MYDWMCPKGHMFEENVPVDVRKDPIGCQSEGCRELADRIEISHSCTDAMLDYGLGLNREALEAGRYDPLNPIQRGVRRHRGESV